ncbi:MAG: 50S ribosomal protein L29 [Flavobacteriales bacterium]|nr:50S ribosomal protein L29 [Flavobacteriales bacterium]MEB2340753.1 50S ribosomal protein L29 [Flavobacteriia bacterium]
MKKKLDTLKDLTDVELQDKLESERSTLTKLRFNHSVSPVDNPSLMRRTRRNVARVLTEMRQRAIAKQAQA